MDVVETVGREARALAAAARRAPEAHVPAAPEWDVLKLVRHVAFLHARLAIALPDVQDNPFRRDDALPGPPKDDILGAYEAGIEPLLAALREVTDPGAPVWTFGGTGPAAFWLRRVLHETAVHRVDVEQAAGLPVQPIPASQAADGVDEVLTTFGRGGAAEVGRTVHLHATDEVPDGGGEWLVTFGPGGLTVDHGHAKGDAAVRGPVEHLFLWLWGRRAAGGLEVFGDESLVATLRSATTV